MFHKHAQGDVICKPISLYDTYDVVNAYRQRYICIFCNKAHVPWHCYLSHNSVRRNARKKTNIMATFP